MLAGALVAAVLAVVPTPFYLIAPGSAVDLRTRIAIEGHAPPRQAFFLTDVIVRKASVLLLASALVPGVRVVRDDQIVPTGVAPDDYDARLVDAMRESQDVAAVVAERAAGYRVASPPAHLDIVSVLSISKAGSRLRSGDELLALDGRAVRALGDVAGSVGAHRAGEMVSVDLVRGGRRVRARVPAIATPKGARLGIVVEARYARPDLPVPVRFRMSDVSGSSGGLMFALDIYRTLRGGSATAAGIAGTGTLAYDGRVGPIEGTAQKLIAAKRAGARVFLVPRENYRDVAEERDVRVVPVATFGQALRSLATIDVTSASTPRAL
jgi:PDZ domain-containing protein